MTKLATLPVCDPPDLPLTEKVFKRDSRIELVRLADLRTDSEYQRDLKPRHQQIVKNLNAQAFGYPLVGERFDKTKWIVDGFQRISGIRKLEYTHAEVEVFKSEGTKHESIIFQIVNMNRTTVTSIEQYRSLLASHDEVAVRLHRVVTACGYKIMKAKYHDVEGLNDKKISCVNLLLNVMENSGEDPIKFSLSLATKCWPFNRDGVHNLVVAGLCAFYTKYNGNYDYNDIEEFLFKLSPSVIIEDNTKKTISPSGPGRMKVADYLYNKYRKTFYTDKGNRRKRPDFSQ